MSEPKGELLMIAGGGTGGHIYPAIAIAREFLSRNPARRVVFVGTAYGLETKIVPREGFPLELVSVGGLKGKSWRETLRNLVRLPLSFFEAWALISRHAPMAIVGVGGYASGPVLLVGALRRLPTLIHEQNAFPGVTNRILARFVRSVAVAFSGALPRLGRRDGTVVGNPVRSEFFVAAATTAPAPARRRLLVFGGSQGSRVLNDSMAAALPLLAGLEQRLEIVHQTGPAELGKVEAAYRGSSFAGAHVVPYLDAMAEEMGSADFVVSRAGAMTLGELAAVGRPAILVPFAAATNNHQELNARAMEAAGAAMVITERELTPELLAEAIREMAGDAARLERMSSAARAAAIPDAAKRVVNIVEEISRN
jgi:UDP-N-acetylglucosamine--N-acetylmuramyl-(pentapeptide) pyrophosphoryl-undecaprenol N-acetylglucosamine transferase